ncbi:MAG TPA: CHC2 zinc finger domain-containing protein [Candidatus Saccharimonadales bacterium]|nr:CHC2 zinc finger domain-containing protein [Candidatus Saccharimonadales bacterium]
MDVIGSTRFDVVALKKTHRLADVIVATGIVLRPVGTNRFSARCPFHDDHVPSLLVDERDGHFHCFGCQAHGDVIDFVMRREGIGFAEACQRLSEAAIPTRPFPPAARLAATERRWDRLTLEQQVVMNTAGAIYAHGLWREAKALDYVRGRGLPDWLIRQCALGYADGHTLAVYLRRRSSLSVAQDLGLLRREGSEFLAGRVVIPELRAGQCVWFIGRRLDDPSDTPKYLALPGERPVLGYERAAGRREVFLCEGVFDQLTAVAWRLAAFSSCGTSLPPDRLGFLARAQVVYGVLDGDAAGHAAARRFGAQLGNRWQPLPLPDGRDLNDLGCLSDGRNTFFALLNATRQEIRTEKDNGA